jgi:phospholipase C
LGTGARWLLASLAGTVVAAAAAAPLGGAVAQSDRDPAARYDTTTPIKHLVVIYQENVSFDHYFGTYPNALNPGGEPAFHAAKGTPSVNGLNDGLLTNNPNLSNPQRLSRAQALTCDQGHDYTQEQSSYNRGLMDKFVEFAGNNATVKSCTGVNTGTAPNYAVMDYYDGNTVTALWNYAQRRRGDLQQRHSLPQTLRAGHSRGPGAGGHRHGVWRSPAGL